MSVQTAKIIDFEERRRAKRANEAAYQGSDHAALAPSMFAMTWVPVWFVPVFFTDGRVSFG